MSLVTRERSRGRGGVTRSDRRRGRCAERWPARGDDHDQQAELKRLLRDEVDKRLAAIAAKKKAKRGPPGPQGPPGQQGAQGPTGSAPAYQGNGSADVMVSAGSVCIDRYEVSVWSSPTGGTQYGVSSRHPPVQAPQFAAATSSIAATPLLRVRLR